MNTSNSPRCRSRWPCGIRHRSGAAHLLGLRVSNPAGSCMSLMNVVCCQVEVSAKGRSLVQTSPTECVCVCVTGGEQAQQ